MPIDTDRTSHDAVTRLFDLVCNGEVDNLEFAQLDSLVYERLQRTYDGGGDRARESIS